MHWLVQGADSANHVQNQTTCYPYMVTRQRKTGPQAQKISLDSVCFRPRSGKQLSWAVGVPSSTTT